MSEGRPTWQGIGSWLAIVLSVVLFAAIALVRIYFDSTGDAVAILYAVPVALLAISFGARGGLAGAVVGYSLFAALTLHSGSDNVAPLGWCARGIGLFLLGGLLGHAVDHSRNLNSWALAEQRRRLELEERNLRERAAVEISDSLIQGMSAAKWLAERDEAEKAIDVLTSTIQRGSSLVTDLLKARLEDGGSVSLSRVVGAELASSLINGIFEVGLSLSGVQTLSDDPLAIERLSSAVSQLDDVVRVIRQATFSSAGPIVA